MSYEFPASLFLWCGPEEPAPPLGKWPLAQANVLPTPGQHASPDASDTKMLAVNEPEPATLTLEQAVVNGSIGTTHKTSMRGGIVLVDNARHGNVGLEGGVTEVDGQVISVRAPERRAGGATIVRTNDLLRLERLTHPGSNYGSIAKVGLEIELLELDRAGHLQGDPADQESTHPELIKGCVEDATEPTADLFEAATRYFDTQRRIGRKALEQERLSYPGSNIADRALTPADLHTEDPYMGPLIDYLGGSEHMAKINIVSQQDHIDDMGSIEAAAWSFDVEEFLSVLEPPLTAASPFSAGQLSPRFSPREPYPTPFARTRYLSARTLTRLAFPEGGVVQQFVPEDRRIIRAIIDARMREGIHSPVRAFGAHANRLRVDYGGRENCTTDTNGAHIESSMSLIALNRAFRYVLQDTYDNGNITRLMDAYPRIIPREFSEQVRRVICINMVTMAQHGGLDSPLIAADGTNCTGQELLKDKIRMVREHVMPDSPYYVNGRMLRWIQLHASRPQTLDDHALDRNGLVSAEGFYRGGAGPLAYYQHARVVQQVNRGTRVADAIANMQVDVALAYSRYLGGLERNLEQRLGFLATVV